MFMHMDVLNFPYSNPEEISNAGIALSQFIPKKSGLVSTKGMSPYHKMHEI